MVDKLGLDDRLEQDDFEGVDEDEWVSKMKSLICQSVIINVLLCICLLYTSPSPRDKRQSRMPSSA